ncbi:MAG: DUF488 domain-containing protein [Patescibacteria group bacterium]
MSRHTLSDGITPDVRISQKSFTYHFSAFGPSARLIGDYYKHGLPFEEFAERYYQEMSAPHVLMYIRRVARVALCSTVTLLCIEHDPFFCHRQLLAALMRMEVPELEIAHCW